MNEPCQKVSVEPGTQDASLAGSWLTSLRLCILKSTSQLSPLYLLFPWPHQRSSFYGLSLCPGLKILSFAGDTVGQSYDYLHWARDGARPGLVNQLLSKLGL